MSLISLGAYGFYAFVSSITPGPKNMLLMTSGATFGFRRTLPQMFGIALGFDIMLFSLVLFPCNMAWIYLGTAIRRWLASPQTRRAVGLVLSLLAIGCGVALWL